MFRTVLALLACVAIHAHAQDRPRQLASACAICHGTDGRGDGKVRDGARPATVMHQIAKGYTYAWNWARTIWDDCLA